MSAETPDFDMPYHDGEIEVQMRLGVHERSAMLGRRMIRSHLIDQHRDFYADLSFLILSSIDDQQRPWASAISGAPEFQSTPDDKTLSIAATPIQGDPLADNLKTGADIGVLGMLPEVRRRNRMTGQVGQVRPYGFDINVLQSFGNCPQYIQARTVEPAGFNPIPPETESFNRFDTAAIEQITNADALFIASAYRDSDTVTQGADASHRGGKPGFVNVLDDRRFVFPDFRGNNAYNTIGNIVKNPKTGFLFIDFQTGDMLTMTGEAQIIWDGPEVEAFEGAQRLVQFEAAEVRGSKAASLTGQCSSNMPHS